MEVLGGLLQGLKDCWLWVLGAGSSPGHLMLAYYEPPLSCGHSTRSGGNPTSRPLWIPAFAGMT